jgi:cell division protease FtsH
MNTETQLIEVVAPAWLQAHRVVAGRTTMDDVIGLEAAKREIRSLAARILHPEVIIAAGGDLPRGVLFYGAPGCGKTTLVRAFVSLLAESGVSLEFYSVAASDLDPARFEQINTWLGNRDASSLVAIYVDEIDWFGRSRDDERSSDATRATLLAALAAIDGLDDRSRNRVLWLASASKHLALLDSALLRPGRFGYHVAVGYPTSAEREGILRHYAGTRRCDPTISWQRAAALAGARVSPAELKQALDDALATAISERGPHAVIGWAEVEEAVLRRGKIVDRRPETADEAWATAVHEAGHAIVAHKLGVKVLSMTLRRDGGKTEAGDDDGPEEPLRSDAQAIAHLTLTLGGLAAEEVILGQHGLGGSSDLSSATFLATRRIRAGIEPAARPVAHDQFDQSPAAQDDLFLATATSVMTARVRAQAIVAAHRSAVLKLAETLLAARHLSGVELERALELAGLA